MSLSVSPAHVRLRTDSSRIDRGFATFESANAGGMTVFLRDFSFTFVAGAAKKLFAEEKVWLYRKSSYEVPLLRNDDSGCCALLS